MKCICPEGWKGDKCQFSSEEEDVSYASALGTGGGSSSKKGAVVGVIIGTGLAVGVMVFLFIRRRKSGIDKSASAGPPPGAFTEPSVVSTDGSDLQDVTWDAPSELESTTVPEGEII